MSGRWRWVALAAVLIALVAGGGAYVVLSRPDTGTPRTTAPAPVRTLPLAALDPATAAGPAPDPTAFRRAIAGAVRDPAFGGHLTGEVVDAATGRELWAREATTPLPPASTTKLLTAAAALEALHPDGTLTTGVVRKDATLWLVGGGDVTLAPRPRAGYPPAADLDDLARRTVDALGTVRRVRLCVDTTVWSGPGSAPGWNTGYFTAGDIAPLSPLEVDEGRVRPRQRPRVADPAVQAAQAFTAALQARAVQVVGPLCRGGAPSSGFGIAAIASARVDALVQHMLTESDNDLAEALGRAVARDAGRPGDFADAADAVLARVRALGVSVEGAELLDTSGLSRLDRVSARTLVELLQVALSPRHPELRALLAGLPVAGFTGTLDDRYRRGPAAAAAGLVRAKTGTLAGVNTLAGTVVDAGGRLLVFAFLTDRAVGPDATEAALDRLAAALGAYR